MKTLVAIISLAALLCGCVGRTGKVGIPIGVRFATQLDCLKVGVSTPDDLKKCFAPRPVALVETKIEGGKLVEIWEVARGGNMDVAAFVTWGNVYYDKDQAIYFRFENKILVAIQTVVLPDGPTRAETPTTEAPPPDKLFN